MITESLINTVRPLAEIIVNKNMAVTALNDTEIGTLVSTLPVQTTSDSFTTEATSDELNYFFGSLIDLTSNKPEGASTYSGIKETLANQIANEVKGHLNILRNIVKPELARYIEQVKTTMSQVSPDNAHNDCSIKVLLTPEPLVNKDVVKDIKSYTEVKTTPPESLVTLGSMSYNELLSKLSNGSDSYNNAVVAYLSRNQEFITNLWERMFGDGDLSYNDLENLSFTNKLETFTCLYLFSRYLINEPDLSKVTVSLNKFNQWTLQFKEWVCITLRQLYALLDLYVDTKTLVVEVESGNKTIYVLNDVYLPWLESGGDVDVLYGLTVSNSKFSTVNQIEVNKEALLSIWYNYNALFEAKNATRMAEIIRNTLRATFYRQLEELSDLEKEYLTEEKGFLDKATSRFEEELGNILTQELTPDNIESLVTKLLCRSRFYFTDAEIFIQLMNEEAHKNPSINPRQAALLAQIEITAIYLADQLQLVK